VSSIPVWLIALVLACAAPYLAGAVESALDARLRRRTLEILARAGAGALALHARASTGAGRTTEAPKDRAKQRDDDQDAPRRAGEE
jgi:hypothetical protein